MTELVERPMRSATASPAPPRIRGAMKNVLSVPLYRNGYALVANTAATTIIGTGFWVLAARYYSAHDVGVGAATINAMLFISGAAQLNLLAFLTRFLPIAGARTKQLVLLSYGVAGAVSALLATGFLVVDALVTDPIVPVGWSWGLYFIAATICWTIFTLQDGVMVGLRDARWVPVENITFGVVKLVLVVALAGFAATSGIFLSWTATTVLGIIPVNWLIFRHLIARHRRDVPEPPRLLDRRAVVGFAAVDWVGSLFLLGITVLLPVLISRWFSSEETAFFAIAWLIGNSIDLLAQNIGASLTVEGAIAPDSLGALAAQALRHLIRMLAVVALVVVVAAPMILSVFGSGYSEHGSTLLRLLALAALPRGINALLVSLARVKQDLRRIVAMQAFNCVTAVVGGYLLSRVIGISGVGLALLIGQSIVLASQVPFLRRVLRGGLRTQDAALPGVLPADRAEQTVPVVAPTVPATRRSVLDRPVVFIGMPRSGTSLISEAFCAHASVGGLTTYSRGTLSQLGSALVFRYGTSRTVPYPSGMVHTASDSRTRRYLPAISEVYYFWDRYSGVDFGRGYLLGASPDRRTAQRMRAKLDRLVRWQGRTRLAVKTTGPARIDFLDGLFPDAVFVHIVRDRDSVVSSLLRVPFWRDGGGLVEPFWNGGLTDADLTRWHESGDDPAVLAGVQWDRIVTGTRERAAALPRDRYLEVTYEEFVGDPDTMLHRMFEFSGLAPSQRSSQFIAQLGMIRNLNVSDAFGDRATAPGSEQAEDLIDLREPAGPTVADDVVPQQGDLEREGQEAVRD